MKTLLRYMTELSSRKTLSRMIGTFAKSAASRVIIARFAKSYGIAVHEAEKPITDYRSLNEFFTRRLKPGSRVQEGDKDTLISPVDSLITAMGTIEAGQLMRIKGQDYTVEELLNRSPRTVNYTNGYFFVLYLSPTDYHRIHTPSAGKIMEREHIPGRVYPVHDFSMRYMKRVLSRNERIVTYLQHEYGEIAIAKVGALNVSSIQYTDHGKDLYEKGEELAYFEFGSTVVLLTESGTFTPREDLKVGQKVQMGQSLGTLHKKNKP